MRFDDSLDTVLSAEMSTPFGAQSTWRQLVDLIGRRRAPADPHSIAKLAAIRAKVPPPVRAASARALAYADPPAALVRLFFDDEIAIAAPVLRVATLDAEDWIDMLPAMSPAARSVLRHRRDLPPDVSRALESFGATDFRLTAAGATAPSAAPEPAETPVITNGGTGMAASALDVAEPEPARDPAIAGPTDTAASMPVEKAVVEHADDIDAPQTPQTPLAELPPAPTEVAPIEPVADEPAADAAAAVPASTGPFVSVGAIALGLPVVAEALRRTEDARDLAPAADAGPLALAPMALAPMALAPTALTPAAPPVEGPFEIAELVARIDAYQRQREDMPAVPAPRTGGDADQPALFDMEPVQAPSFRFETDAAGVVRWIEGAARAPLIGLSLDLATSSGAPAHGRVDGIAGGAFRRRAGFADARLVVDGTSDAAGQWRITGLPVFDRASGRFTGYRGTARRPRADESAEPVRSLRSPAADALRQLVHELRTPTNAIAGFAEMIEAQMLGPVSQPYRDRAGTIRGQAAGLLTAIDDIDMAARLESHALDLRAEQVPLAPLLERVAEDLGPLATLRGTDVRIDPGPIGLAVAGDERAVERLIGRLMSTLVASGSAGERIDVAASLAEGQVALLFGRPRALAAFGNDAILTIDAEAVAEAEGAPLLGTGFALRLARNLATELGGALTIDAQALTLRLPAAVIDQVGQASSS